MFKAWSKAPTAWKASAASGLSYCLWSFVTCSQGGNQVINLALSGGGSGAGSAKLSGSIPVSIVNLKYLQTLDLSYNALIGSIPPLPTSLVSLVLRGNQLTGSIPKTLTSLTALTVMDFSNNALSGSLPTAYPYNTVYLNVGGNSITGGWPANAPSSMSAITYIDVSNNMMTGTIPSWLGGGSTIQSLARTLNCDT